MANWRDSLPLPKFKIGDLVHWWPYGRDTHYPHIWEVRRVHREDPPIYGCVRLSDNADEAFNEDRLVAASAIEQLARLVDGDA